MVKEIKVKETQAQLQEKNAQLKAKIKTLETLQTPQPHDSKLDKYMAEMTKIKSTARVDSGAISVTEFADHKNISLWTRDGKRIGPLHQSNALRTFQLFWELGRFLSTERPTPEQIVAYKESDEYKKWLAAHLKMRAIKDRSKKSGQIEKLTAEIAKLSGVTVEALNKILKPGEVQNVSAHLKNE